MIKLHTFGGAILFGDDGRRLLGAASQRRILGLLSVLAASSERGVTRDKIVGILWPDSAPPRARHSLTQTMYAARKALACDDLFEATEDIRLNPARISSDVGAFESAFRSGDDAAAAALYQGPFLDGFYVSSSEYEWWVHHQRTRLEEEAVAAFQRLVAEAEERAEWEKAAAYLRRLAAIRPSDSSVAVRLMKALAAAGDRAGAIQHAVMHERVLREQYELEPEPQVLSLAAELREGARSNGSAPPATAEAGPEPVPAAAVAGALPAAAVAPAPAPVQVPTAGPALPAAPIWPSAFLAPLHASAGAWAEARALLHHAMLREALLRRPLRSGRWGYAASRAGWLTAAGLVLVLGAVLALWLVDRPPRAAAYRPLDQRVVVTPFRVTGADPALEYLRDGMADMLSTRLADDTAARSVDAGAVLAAWRRAGITRSTELPRDSVVRLAARLGALRVVVGNIVGTPARLVMNATVLDVPSGEVAGQATVEGSADRLNELVDQLAARLLLVEAGESDRLADHTTRSLPALRAYLAGVAADARDDHAVAADAYVRALQLDSAFALSALHLGIAAARLNDYQVERDALHRAWRFRGGLSDRDEAELLALLGPRYPAPSTAGQALAAWEAAARLAPNREEVWLGLARRILTDGEEAGLGNVRDRALSALRRAMVLDPNDAAARLLLARIGGAQAVPLRPQLADPGKLPLRPFFQWWDAVERGDGAELARVLDSLPSAGPGNLRQIAAAGAFAGLRPEDGARALEILSGRAADGDQALGLLLAQHSLALERGLPSRALEITRAIGRLGPTGRPHLRLRLLDAVFGEGDTAAAAAAAQELRRTASNRDLPNTGADACALAQWQLARLDIAGARASLVLLQAASAEDPPTAVGSPAPFCAALIGAALAVETGQPRARALVAGVDSLVLTSAGAGDVAAYGPIVIARLYRRLGDPAEALAAIRRRPFFAAVWPRYLATELEEEAELAREVGDLAGAAGAYRAYLALRGDPEPSLEREVRTVRADAATLPAD